MYETGILSRRWSILSKVPEILAIESVGQVDLDVWLQICWLIRLSTLDCSSRVRSFQVNTSCLLYLPELKLCIGPMVNLPHTLVDQLTSELVSQYQYY